MSEKTEVLEAPEALSAPTGLLLLAAPQAARTLSISERKLWEISAPRGPLPTVRIGKRVLYSPADLARFIAAGGTP